MQRGQAEREFASVSSNLCNFLATDLVLLYLEDVPDEIRTRVRAVFELEALVKGSLTQQESTRRMFEELERIFSEMHGV